MSRSSTAGSRKGLSLTLIAVCQVAVLALWFSATAVVPALRADYVLSETYVALLTSSVQAGFVVGTLASAFLGLADRIDSRRVFMISALIAAGANALMLALPPGSDGVVVCRFVTGACMAGVYPVGMKMAASWAQRDMGLLVGLLIGALTIGSATPHLIDALAVADWRVTVVATSAIAAAGGLAINLAGLGPNFAAAPKFEWRHALEAWTKPALRLANGGYLGHMWELYAMWAWIGAFLLASFSQTMDPEAARDQAKLATFATIAIGVVGCVGGGWLADRLGRTTLTIAAMTLSGLCALTVGFLFGGPPWALLLVCLIWGVAVIADSAQFSASVAELASPQLVGTMLTVQTCAGFLLTLSAIHLLPPVIELIGWRYAFIVLAPGPFLGVWAMARLRALPAALALAGGRR